MVVTTSPARVVEGFSAAEIVAISVVVEQLPLAAAVHSLDGVIIAVNDEFRGLLGYAHDELTGIPALDLVPEPDRRSARQLTRTLDETSAMDARGRSASVRSLRRLRRRDGTFVSCWMHLGVGVLAGRRVVVVCVDLVAPLVHDAHQWRARAERDDLTGLYRRTSFLDHIQSWITDERLMALAFIDVDHLKRINDTFGHSAGDCLLRAVAHRLGTWRPDNAVVGRFAGDEFVLAVPDPDFDRCDAFCAELREHVCREPVLWQGHLLQLSVSVGAVTRRAGEADTELIARADELMYIAKTAENQSTSVFPEKGPK
ncbi:sensor domain-containing diguanylate cyclase [Rhodococcus fascians]|nr:sensor domain-containing diguanylate cyclase [Rhodococcus fascians]MBY4431966.1 sensor domain-containing diguanylate cyclase [Rhodococcus fascians]